MKIFSPRSGHLFTHYMQTSNSVIITIKQSYKGKDWNKIIKVRRDANINMPHRKIRKPALLRYRVQHIILKGKGVEQNKDNKKK